VKIETYILLCGYQSKTGNPSWSLNPTLFVSRPEKLSQPTCNSFHPYHKLNRDDPLSDPLEIDRSSAPSWSLLSWVAAFQILTSLKIRQAQLAWSSTYIVKTIMFSQVIMRMLMLMMAENRPWKESRRGAFILIRTRWRNKEGWRRMKIMRFVMRGKIASWLLHHRQVLGCTAWTVTRGIAARRKVSYFFNFATSFIFKKTYIKKLSYNCLYKDFRFSAETKYFYKLRNVVYQLIMHFNVW